MGKLIHLLSFDWHHKNMYSQVRIKRDRISNDTNFLKVVGNQEDESRMFFYEFDLHRIYQIKLSQSVSMSNQTISRNLIELVSNQRLNIFSSLVMESLSFKDAMIWCRGRAGQPFRKLSTFVGIIINIVIEMTVDWNCSGYPWGAITPYNNTLQSLFNSHRYCQWILKISFHSQ